MPTLTAADLLNVWEAGREQSPLDRATLLLLVAFPEFSWEAIEALPVGRVEALLIQLRQSLFGPAMESVAACPACNERLEFAFTGADLGAGSYPEPPQRVSLEQDGYRLTLRLPTGADIRAASGNGDRLLDHLLVEATHDDGGNAHRIADPSLLPDAVVEAAATTVQAADPLADVTISLSCPACRHQWAASFDAISYFWREIEAWAVRTLHAVHTLASQYGWQEDDILAMSAWRRSLYLEMIGE